MTDQKDDIWFASKVTRLVTPADNLLNSFSDTAIKLHLVCEHPDDIHKTTVHTGTIFSKKPEILNKDEILKSLPPEAMAKTSLNGLEENANIVVQLGDTANCVKYDLKFKRDGFEEMDYDYDIEETISLLKEETPEDELIAAGVEDIWQFCLMHTVLLLIQGALGSHMEDFLAERSTAKMLNPEGLLQDDIESAFIEARHDHAKISDLADLLQKNNIFSNYEDRFYALIKNGGSNDE